MQTATIANGALRLKEIRQEAALRFAELGYPTTHDEDWKYTNVNPIASTEFRPGPVAAEGIAERIRQAGFGDASRLVFVNGHFSKELSGGAAVKGVRAGNLAANFENDHLAGYAAFRTHAFVAQNTANFEDGGYIEIAKGAVPGEPLFLIFVSTGGADQPTVSYPRNLIVAHRDSQASVVEVYLGLNGGSYFTNSVTELVAAEGAVLQHYKLGLESESAYHFGLLRTEQGRSSTVTSHVITLGGGLVRNEINAVLAGEGAETTLNGLYVLAGRQHVDNHTTIDHAMPRCTSHELYKGILDGRSEGVFHGRIIVRPDAQRTDAIQRNRNLLLSQDAVINTKPQLEIYADDVRCTHGATVGQVDQDAVFYMRSRGIGLAEARSLLTYAFASEVIGNINIESVRSRLADAMLEKFSA